ncbi:hypothetical protein N9Y89_01470 [bacterium]|nr:hypothetical protein [bacterium]
MRIVGTLVESQGSGQKVEITAQEIEVLGEASILTNILGTFTPSLSTIYLTWFPNLAFNGTSRTRYFMEPRCCLVENINEANVNQHVCILRPFQACWYASLGISFPCKRDFRMGKVLLTLAFFDARQDYLETETNNIADEFLQVATQAPEKDSFAKANSQGASVAR